jgi:hypothetical protein
VLTALRRAEGKPDPLQIVVEPVKVDDSGNPTFEPRLKVYVINRDVQPVYYVSGCDDRSGRRTRWRIHLWNEAGEQVPDARFPSLGMGGGIGTLGPLPPGDSSWNYRFDLRRYVQPPKSGLYKMQLIHASRNIANEPDLTGLVTLKSEPIWIRVHNFAEYQQAYEQLPPMVLVTLGVVTFSVACFRQTPNLHLAMWLSVVFLISLGWLLDCHELEKELSKWADDSNATWTMEIVQSP